MISTTRHYNRIPMDRLKNEPQSLAVSDLQLLVAFFMRNGIDLTSHMKENETGFIIEYEPETEISIIANGSRLVAQFNKDYRTVFCKFEASAINEENDNNNAD